MRCPESETGYVEICVLAWLKVPWPCHGDSNAAGVSRECLHNRFRSPHVPIQDSRRPQKMFRNPESNNTVEDGNLGEVG